MEVQLSGKLEYIHFYNFTLKLLMEFYNDDFDNELVLDFRKATYIFPAVICDLVSYIYLLHESKEVSVYILFGSQKKPVEYLANSDFFLLSDFGNMFQTDAQPPLSHNEGMFSRGDYSQKENTGKFKKVRLSTVYSNKNCQYMFKNSLLNTINQDIAFSVSRLFLQKVELTKKYNLNFNLVTSAYNEMMKNSFLYGSNRDASEKYCIYTFQYYSNADFLSFVNSDTGDGFYKSLFDKFQRKNDYAPSILASKAEYYQYLDDTTAQSLVGIIECLCMWLNKNKTNYGLIYILNLIVLQNHGKVTIHSGNTMVEIDESFINKYFFIDKDINQIVKFNRTELRALLARKKDKNILYFPYSFPGVHMYANIGDWGNKYE